MSLVPACCSTPDDRWPWPQSLPGLELISLDFDPDNLKPDDFTISDIVPPPSVERAVAKRQAEYLAGRFCAREGLLRATGQPVVPALGDDRAPFAIAQDDPLRRPALHRDHFLDHIERLPGPAMAVKRRIVGVRFQHEQV